MIFSGTLTPFGGLHWVHGRTLALLLSVEWLTTPLWNSELFSRRRTVLRTIGLTCRMTRIIRARPHVRSPARLLTLLVLVLAGVVAKSDSPILFMILIACTCYHSVIDCNSDSRCYWYSWRDADLAYFDCNGRGIAICSPADWTGCCCWHFLGSNPVFPPPAPWLQAYWRNRALLTVPVFADNMTLEGVVRNDLKYRTS